MLARLLSWRTAQPTPQDEFRALHAALSNPPAWEAPPSSHSVNLTAELSARIVDPYHLIVCQHGVLGTSADFDNVVADLFVHHEVSVMEGVEQAQAAQVGPKPAKWTRSASCSSSSNNTATHCRGSGTGSDAASRCSPEQQRHGCAEGNTGPRHTAAPLRPDTALTAEEHRRRSDYKQSFRLAVEHPNSTCGRLYRSGNLSVFSPGSNNYLGTDAGTVACARAMLAETVPQLHAWLDGVEASERQRRARWAVYACVTGSIDAAQLAREAATPLPVCLSLMGHSFGGIIEREFLYLLLTDDTETAGRDAQLYRSIVRLRHRLRALRVTFENFLTIATPHCGTGECLWWPIYVGAWCLARLRLCQTYDELILTDREKVLQTRLLDGPHLRVLQLFRRRVLFANTHRDMLVGFGTCSLLFEDVATDHTKFVGVPATQTHCAAAFANDGVEISRPILLCSAAEEAAAAKAAWVREAARHLSPSLVLSSSSTTGAFAPTLPSATAGAFASRCVEAEGSPTHTMADLAREDGSSAAEPQITASETEEGRVTLASLEAGYETAAMACVEETPRRSKKNGTTVFSATPRPLPTRSAAPSLSSPSASPAASCSLSTVGGAVTVGRTVPSRHVPEVTLDEILPFYSWRRTRESVWEHDCSTGFEEGQDEARCEWGTTRRCSDSTSDGAALEAAADDAARQCLPWPPSSSLSSGKLSMLNLSVQVNTTPPPPLSPTASRGASTSTFAVSPRLCDGPSQFSLRASTCGCSAVSDWDSSSSSTVSSRRSRRSSARHVAAVLRDPRWASEHVCGAAAVVQDKMRRCLSSSASWMMGGEGRGAVASGSYDTEKEGYSTSDTTAASSSPAAAAAAAAASSVPSSSSFLLSAEGMPQYRQTPRAIAAVLRERLSWRVRAVRFDNVIPVGHVACLGNWAFCGRSPVLVQSVAEELLMVL